MELLNKESILAKAVSIPGNFSKYVSLWDIVHMKPIEARPIVHAYWKKEVEDGMYWYVCSECGGEIPKTRYKSDFFSDFCPHCGAQMDQEADEQE